MPLYTVKVGRWVSGTWTVDATLARANVDWVEQVLDDLWSAQFHMHTLDPEAWTYLRPEYLGGRREVQIWRSTTCIFWGVPLQARTTSETVTFSCVGLLWYYSRRYFGPIVNHYGTNTDFESGTTGWTAVGTTFTVDNAWRALGTQSAKLVSASAGQNNYIQQTHTTTTLSQPVFFAFKAMFHLLGTGWVGPALEERGLYLEARDASNNLVAGPVWEPITNATPRDHHRPVRLETGITVPAGLTNAVVVRRIYSPGGTIRVDATDIVTEESVGSAVTGEPVNSIISEINTYTQDPAQGKSALNIGFEVAAGSFASRVRIYQFFDNGNIWEALKEFPREGLCDLEIVWNAGATTRSLKLWPGTKGSHKAAAGVTLGTNLVDGFEFDVDAGRITTKPRVLGQGEGADREIGEVQDTSQMDGLVLESVASAPLESPIDALASLAAQDLAETKAPVRVPSFRRPASQVVGVTEVGDTIPVTADYGYIQEGTVTRRIISQRFDAHRDVVAVRVV